MPPTSGSPAEARRRLAAARKRLRYARERGGDTARAERLLQKVEEALKANDAVLAQNLATQAGQAAEDARKQARARQLIASAERSLQEAAERGADVEGGRPLLDRAEEVLKAGLYADVQKWARQARDLAEKARRRRVAEDGIHRVEKVLEAEAGEGSDVSAATPTLGEAWKAVEDGRFGTVPKLLHKASRVAEEAKRVREATEALDALEGDLRDLGAMKADPSAAEKAAEKVRAALKRRDWKAIRKHLQQADRAVRKARKERERELTLTVVEQLVEQAGTGGVSALGARELLEEVEKALGRGRYTDIDTLVEAKFEAEATKRENEVLRDVGQVREALAELRVAGLEVSAAAKLLGEAEGALRGNRPTEAQRLAAKARDLARGLRETLKASAERALGDLQREVEDLRELEVTTPQGEEFARRAAEALEKEDAFGALDLARLGMEACKAAMKAHVDGLAEAEVKGIAPTPAAENARDALDEARRLSALLDRADLDRGALDNAVHRAQEALDAGEGGTLSVLLQVVAELGTSLRTALETRLRSWLGDLESALQDLPADAQGELRDGLDRLRNALEDGSLEVALEASLSLEHEILEAQEAPRAPAPVSQDELRKLSVQFVKVKKLLESLRSAGIDVSESQEQFHAAEGALQRRDLERAAAVLTELEEMATAVQGSLAHAARDFIASARLKLERAAKKWAPVPEGEEMLRNAEELFQEARYDEAIELARLAERKTRARMERFIDEAHGEVAERLGEFHGRLARLRDVLKDLGRADISIEGAEETLDRVHDALEEADFERGDEPLTALEEMAEVLSGGLKDAARDLLGNVDRELREAEGGGLAVPRGKQVIVTAREALAQGRHVEALEYCKVIEDIVTDAREKVALEGLKDTLDALRRDLTTLEERGVPWERAYGLLQEVERAAKDGYLDRALALQEGLQAVLEDLGGAPLPEEGGGETPLDVERALQALHEAERALETGEAQTLAGLLTEARRHLGANRQETAQRLADEMSRALQIAEAAGLTPDEARAVFEEAQGLLQEAPEAALDALRRARDLLRESAKELPAEATPAIVLELPEEGLEAGRWTRFHVHVRNTGKVPAKEVTLRLRGDLEVRAPDPIPEVGPGETHRVEVEARPRGEGELPVQVEMSYRGFFDERPILATEDRRVVAAPRGTYVVEDVFLVHSDGRLIAHDTRKPQDEIDEDIFSGMLTVVQDFVKDSFRQRTDLGLRRLEFGDSKILIERGSRIYLAAVLTGKEPELLSLYMVELLNEIERTYGPTLEGWSGLLSELAGIEDIVGRLCYFTSDADIRGPEADTALASALRLVRGGRALGLDLSESEAALQAAQEAAEEDTERAWALLQDAVEKALASQQDLQARLEKGMAALEGDLRTLARFGLPTSEGEVQLDRARTALVQGDYEWAARVIASLEETLSSLKEEVVSERIGTTMEKLAATLSALDREGADTAAARSLLEQARGALEEGHLGTVADVLAEADETALELRRTFFLDRQRAELNRIQRAYEEASTQGLLPAEAQDAVRKATEAAERGDVDELEILVGLAREAVLGPLEASRGGKEPRIVLRAPPATLQAGTWTRYEVEVGNEGDWPAEDVELEFGEDVEVKGKTGIDRLEPGEGRRLELGLLARREGETAVDLQVRYARALDRTPEVAHYLRDFQVAPQGTYLVEDALFFLADGQVMAHESRTFRETLDRESFGTMLQAIQEFLADAFQDGRRVGIKRMEFGDSKVLLERGERGYLAAVVLGKEPDLLPLYLLQVLREVEEVHGPELDGWSAKAAPSQALRRTVQKVLLITDAPEADLGPLARSPVTARLLYGLDPGQRRAQVEALLPQLEEALTAEGLEAGVEVVESALGELPQPPAAGGKRGGGVDFDDEALKEYIETVREIDRAVRKARGKAGLEFHWPASRIAIRAKTPAVASASTNFKAMIMSHANAKEMDILEAGDIWKGVNLKMQIHEGALTKAYKLWARKIELILRSQDPWKIKAGIERGGYQMGIEGQVIEIRPDMVSFQAEVPPHIVVQEFPDGMVFLDTRMTEETEAEGFANEIAKIVLEARKDLGIEDRVQVVVRIAGSEKLRRLLGLKKGYVLQEANAQDLTFPADVGEEGYVADVEIGAEAFGIAILPAP